MTAEQAVNQAELVSFFAHDDREEAIDRAGGLHDDNGPGPYGPGVTARATAAAQAALGCSLCVQYGREHDSHCADI